MKTKNIFIIAGVVTGTLGLMSMTGTFLPAAKSSQTFVYSDAVSAQESVYGKLVKTRENATTAHTDAAALERSTAATEESAYQSECAQQIVIVNTKLSELGDSNPEEKQRLEGVKLDAQSCMIVHTTAVNFNQ